MLRSSLVAVGIGALNTAAAVVQQTFQTTGFTRYITYNGDYNVSGDVIATVQELGETVLNIALFDIDPDCIESRTAGGLPTHGCSIYIDEAINCSNPLGPLFVQATTSIDPWRDGNYYNTTNNATSRMIVRAGTGMEYGMFLGRAVFVHDSNGDAAACGLLNNQGHAALTTLPGYTKNTVNGNVIATTEMVKVTILTAKGELSNVAAGLFNVDPVCTPLFSSNASNFCGIHIHEGTSCTEPAGPHYWDRRVGSADPWKEIRYSTVQFVYPTPRTPQGNYTNAAEVPQSQPAFTGNVELAGRTLVVHDSTGARIACSVLEATSTLLTTTPAADSSSIPWWGILLIVLGALALLGALIAALSCSGNKKKRGLNKKSSKKRAVQAVESAPLDFYAPPASQAVATVPVYSTPVYTAPAVYASAVAHVAPPVYAAPAATQVYAAPVATSAPGYAAPVQRSAAPVYASSVSMTAAPVYAAQTAPVPTYAAPIATYQTTVATNQSGSVTHN